MHPSFDRGAVQTAGRERLTRIGRIKMESVLDEWSAGLELIRSFKLTLDTAARGPAAEGQA